MNKSQNYNDEPRVALHWGPFWGKMLLSVIWLMAATLAASLISKSQGSHIGYYR
jgi:hypothetical protein